MARQWYNQSLVNRRGTKKSLGMKRYKGSPYHLMETQLGTI